MMALTGDQANDLSIERARRNQQRLAIIAVLALAAALLLGWNLQRQQTQLTGLVEANEQRAIQMCLQRRANTIRTNNTWDTLSRIASQNVTLPESVRREQVSAYEHAKLEIPECIP